MLSMASKDAARIVREHDGQPFHEAKFPDIHERRAAAERLAEERG